MAWRLNVVLGWVKRLDGLSDEINDHNEVIKLSVKIC